MKTLDFHRSFIVFEIDFDRKPPKTVSDSRQNKHNRARVQIDCRCQVTDPDGKATDYFLGESCKTERVGVSPDVGIFTQPNADFRPVMSDECVIFFKSWDKNDKGVMLHPPSLGPQPERQVVNPREAFYRHTLQLQHTRAALLADAREIIAAADAGQPLVARTEYAVAGYEVVLEYPVLTLNVSEQHLSYQTDTGPVLFPELNQPHARAAETFRLAFCAFNTPDWIEFIVQKPTPIGNGVSVNHYSETVQIAGCRNSILAV
jgi:hypothetical protein